MADNAPFQTFIFKIFWGGPPDPQTPLPNKTSQYFSHFAPLLLIPGSARKNNFPNWGSTGSQTELIVKLDSAIKCSLN